jgi:cilia- and flagella-associated protein 44
MAGCQAQLADFKGQLDAVGKRKADIAAALDGAVDEGHPQRDALLAVFNRKLKRGKRRDEESEEEESDDDDGDDDDSDGGGDDAQEICPPGCDQALYDEARHPPLFSDAFRLCLCTAMF